MKRITGEQLFMRSQADAFRQLDAMKEALHKLRFYEALPGHSVLQSTARINEVRADGKYRMVFVNASDWAEIERLRETIIKENGE